MFFVCLNIDFVRQVLIHYSSGILDAHPIFCFVQSHMRYKVRSIIISRKLAERGIPDLSLLPVNQRLAVFATLGITFGPRDTTSL